MNPTPSAVQAEPREAGSLRLLVVANPHASTTTDAVLEQVLGILSEAHDVQAALTTHQGHATELCRSAATDGYDAVVVLGGDGTLNEAANGLVGSATALAPLPGGANNVYARMLGIPLDVLAATRRLTDVRRLAWQDLDLGRVNDRWFIFSAGVGLDASVVARVDRHPRRKARWGPWYFAQVGLSVFLGGYVRRPPALTMRAGDEAVPAVTVLVQNGNPYSYFGRRPIVLAPDAGLHSGDLGAVGLTRARATDLPFVLWRALAGWPPVAEHPAVRAVSSRQEIVVASADGRPVPLQVDGDHIGEALEARFTVAAGALRVVS